MLNAGQLLNSNMFICELLTELWETHANELNYGVVINLETAGDGTECTFYSLPGPDLIADVLPVLNVGAAENKEGCMLVIKSDIRVKGGRHYTGGILCVYAIQNAYETTPTQILYYFNPGNFSVSGIWYYAVYSQDAADSAPLEFAGGPVAEA